MDHVRALSVNQRLHSMAPTTTTMAMTTTTSRVTAIGGQVYDDDDVDGDDDDDDKDDGACSQVCVYGAYGVYGYVFVHTYMYVFINIYMYIYVYGTRFTILSNTVEHITCINGWCSSPRLDLGSALVMLVYVPPHVMGYTPP